MNSLSKELDKLRQARALTNLQFSELLGLDHTVMSRLCAGKKGASYGIMSRLLIKLDAGAAHALLQAYFDDELERIAEGRIEKAHELKVEIKELEWPFCVTVNKL